MAQQVKIIRKGGFFGKLLALLLGIIIGIVAGIGGLAGILYYAFGIVSIGEVLGIVENATSMDIPAEEYVGEEYLDKTLIQALTDAFGVVGGVTTGANTFGDIAKISPYLASTIGGLTGTLDQYGIELTEEEFMAMSVPGIGEYLQSSFSNLALAPLITQFGGQAIDPDNAIACSIFYGEKGVHYQVIEENGEKKIEMLPICYTLEDNGAFSDATDNIYVNSNGVWTNLNGDGVIKAESATSADETRNYDYAYYTVKDGVEKFVYRLALKDGSTNVYIAYKSDDTEKLYTGATISTLLSTDLMNTVYSLPLADVLGLDANSDTLMLALAYGEYGYATAGEEGNKYFTYVTDQPKTLNDLIEGGSTLVTDMSIATVTGLNLNDAESISPAMKALAFGTADDPNTTEDDTTANYKIENNKIIMLNNSKPKTIASLNGNTDEIFGDVKLGDIIEITSSSSQILKSLQYTKVKDLNTKISSLTLNNVVAIPADSLIMNSLATTKIDQMGTAIDELKMSQIMEIKTEGTDKSPAILIALKDTKVKELSSKLNTLTIGEIIDNASTNTILKHLEKSTVSSLSEDVNKLTIQQVFCDDVYQKVYFAGTTQVYKNGDKYYINPAYTIQYTGSEPILDLFVATESKATTDAGSCQYLFHDPADNKYHYYNVATATESTQTGKPVLTGIWSYLLTKDGVEQPYALTQTGHLIDNMTVNIQKATLQELSDNKLFILDQETLDNAVVTTIKFEKVVTVGNQTETVIFEKPITSGPTYVDKKVGELTVAQLMGYVNAVLNALSSSQV